MRTGSQLLALAVGLAGLNIWAQAIPLTGEPRHDSGQSIIGAYEGWFPNADGSFSLLAGYYNRNFAEEVDIPIGPNNKIEPGGPDQGQPTHFYPGRWLQQDVPGKTMFTVCWPDLGSTLTCCV
jgi:hypothetical protein